LLLVVDNCEHLLGAAAHLVSEIIRAAPEVRVIATTREPLSVSGEQSCQSALELPSALLPAFESKVPEATRRSRTHDRSSVAVTQSSAAWAEGSSRGGTGTTCSPETEAVHEWWR